MDDRAAASFSADCLEPGMQQKTIRQSDPWLAAMQLKSLLEADIYTRRILNIDKKTSKKTILAAVDNALAVFWAYYKVSKPAA